jgi:hypothetical protein
LLVAVMLLLLLLVLLMLLLVLVLLLMRVVLPAVVLVRGMWRVLGVVGIFVVGLVIGPILVYADVCRREVVGCMRILLAVARWVFVFWEILYNFMSTWVFFS